MTATFDAHEFIDRITAAGMPEPQAEVLAEVFSDSQPTIGRSVVLAAIEEAAIGTNKRVDGVERRLGERIDGVENRLGERIDGVENRLGAVEHRLDGVENRLGAVENRLGAVEYRLDGVENRLGGIEHRLGAVEQGQSVLMENQLQTNNSLNAIMQHLGITKP